MNKCDRLTFRKSKHGRLLKLSADNCSLWLPKVKNMVRLNHNFVEPFSMCAFNLFFRQKYGSILTISHFSIKSNFLYFFRLFLIKYSIGEHFIKSFSNFAEETKKL